MFTRSTPALLALLLAVPGAGAAPAPLGPTDQAATVVTLTGPASTAQARQELETLLKSSAVLQAAVRKPAVARLDSVKRAPDPTRWLASRLKVSPAGGDGKVRVAVGGCAPREAVALLEAVVAAGQDAALGEVGRRNQERLQMYRDRRREIAAIVARAGAGVNPVILERYDRQIQQMEEMVRSASRLRVVQAPKALR
jgi:hypothetical protein